MADGTPTALPPHQVARPAPAPVLEKAGSGEVAAAAKEYLDAHYAAIGGYTGYTMLGIAVEPSGEERSRVLVRVGQIRSRVRLVIHDQVLEAVSGEEGWVVGYPSDNPRAPSLLSLTMAATSNSMPVSLSESSHRAAPSAGRLCRLWNTDRYRRPMGDPTETVELAAPRLGVGGGASWGRAPTSGVEPPGQQRGKNAWLQPRRWRGGCGPGGRWQRIRDQPPDWPTRRRRHRRGAAAPG